MCKLTPNQARTSLRCQQLNAQGCNLGCLEQLQRLQGEIGTGAMHSEGNADQGAQAPFRQEDHKQSPLSAGRRSRLLQLQMRCSKGCAASVQATWLPVCAQLKDFGKNLLMGNLNLINVSLPVKMFEPRSYLQKLADAWLYTNWLQVPEPQSRV